MNLYLSVVIPCYNEEANLKRGVLKEVQTYLRKQKYSWEVIIADDGSTDQSKNLIQKFTQKNRRFRLLENKHGGKAFALRAGIEKAKGKIILTTDMDQSTPLKEIEKLLPWFAKDYPVVIGSRGIRREGFPWYRQLMSVAFRGLRGLFILPQIIDTQCGFKAYQSPVIKKIFPRLEVFKEKKKAKGWRVSAFDVEILFIARKWHYKIKEVIVDWQDRDVSETKAHNFLKESQSMATEIFRVKLNDWQGKYDL